MFEFRKILLIGIAAIMLFVGCGQDSDDTDTVAPDAPLFVQKSVEFAEVEFGIDAVTQGNWIYLEWLPNQEDDLEGYQLWRKGENDTTGIFTMLDILPVTQLIDASNPEYSDMSPEIAPNPSSGMTEGFYYYLTAYDRNGTISAPSDTVYYMLMRKPIAVNMDAAYDTVRWSYPFNTGIDVEFVIRVYRQDSGFYIWRSKYSGGQDPFTVKYNFDNSANLMGVGDYYLRVDVYPKTIQDEKYSGAESNLHAFTVQ